MDLRRGLWAVGAIGAIQIVIGLSPLDPQLRLVAIDLFQPLAAAVGCAGAFVAARRTRGTHRLAWASIALGLAFYVAGQVLWSFEELVLGNRAPVDGLSQFGFLPAVPLVGLGLVILLFASGATVFAAAGVMLDGVVLAGGTLLLVWPLAKAGASPVTSSAGALPIVYVGCALLLATISALGCRRHVGTARKTFVLFALGFFAMTVGAVHFARGAPAGAFDPLHPANVGFGVGALLFGVAGWLARGELSPFRPADWSERALPFAMLLIAVVGVLISFDTHDERAVEIAFVLVLIVAIGRQALQSLELDGLVLERDEALAFSEALFGSIPLPVAAIDRSGRIVRANHEFTRHFPKGKALGLDALSFVIPGEREAVAAKLGKAFEGGALSFEANVTSVEGETRHVIVAGQAIGTKDGPLLLAATLDVTERRRAEESLRRNERAASLATLVAGVAHEINNPLMYARGSVEIIEALAKERGMDDVVDDAARAIRGLDRIAQIVDGLRSFASPSSGAHADAPLSPMVERAIALAKPQLGPDVVLQTALASRASVHANADELSQVFVHLILNASDAMKGRAGTLRVETRDGPGGVEIAVSDTGAGIPPEARSRIFTPFYTTKPEGTGLALSNCHAVVVRHGGDITFTSEPGRGTTFRVRLPAVAAASHSPGVSTEVARPAYGALANEGA